MKVTGIIAEYNPFHKGHEYQIKKARELTDADYVIVVMSGDFTQRGAPALLDKYTRARMALACGADGLMIEVHNDPAHALSDGPQSLTFEKFARLTEELTPYARLAGRTFR